MDENRLEELGLLRVCRGCLSDEGEMKNVFISKIEDDEDNVLSKIFEIITSLELSEIDGMPHLICLKCEDRLYNAYSFRRQCQRSYSTLRKYIDNTMHFNIKQQTESVEEPEYKTENYENYEMKEEECTLEMDDNVEQNGNSEEANENTEDNDDVDDQPLSTRQDNTRHKSVAVDADVINQALKENKRKYNESRECRICGFISSNARGLSLHISHLHKELKDRWCGICYTEVDDLSAHLKNHSKIKSYICQFCGKGFSSQGHLTEHIRSHSTDRPHKCKECGKGFLSARHLRVHLRIHSGEKPFQCPHCGRKFTQNGSLQGHIRTHTGLKPYPCEVCEKTFTTSSALASHRVKTGHVSTTKNVSVSIKNNEVKNESDDLLATDSFERVKPNDSSSKNTNIFGDVPNNMKLCTVCGKTFTTSSKLRMHMRVHTGETPYKCNYCDKRFSTRGSLVVHVRTHTGERPHVCHVCGKGFAQSSVLNTHMKLHTGRPEVCQICQQRFCRPAELRLHMRKHTGEKPYLCTECGQAFIQRSHLMEHIKIHSDERPYKCNLCERAFKQSSSLKSHIQIHSGLKPYQCSQCPYACRQSYALTQHMKHHSSDLPQADRPHECIICHKTFTTIAMLNSHSRSVHNAVFDTANNLI